MKAIRAACGQFRAAAGDTRRNISAMERLAAKAAGRGCDLIVFPELCTTGYVPAADIPPLAETVDGPSARALGEAARRLGIAVVFGMAERAESGTLHNCFVVLDAHGRRAGLYRKVHLWDSEARWASPGREFPVFELCGVPTTGWICYDTRFPETGRAAFLRGAELAVVPTAWLGPAEEWELALRARALDNAMFVAGADLINPLPGLECRGVSLIAGPRGEVLARAEPGRECVIDAVLDPAVMAAQRNRLPLRRDRRPELYGALAEIDGEAGPPR